MFIYISENISYLTEKLWQHFYLFLISWIIAVVIGVAIGVFVTRPGRKKMGDIILSITGAAQSVPSIAVISLVFLLIGMGATPAIIALFLYSLVPVVFNTASGLFSIDPSMLEAARGMGMTPSQVLYKIELPVAVTPISSGIRSAATINIGTATVAAVIGSGGLGEMIFIGLSVMNNNMILTGALFSAIMAITVDTIISFIEYKLTSEGIRVAD